MSNYSEESKGSGIVSSLIYLAFFALWVMGILHSYKAHSKIDFLASFIPPWGMYRGAESFFHKTKAANKKELSAVQRETGVYKMFQLMAANPETDEERTEVQKGIDEFTVQLKKCSSTDYEYMKAAARMYARFLFSAGRDMKRFMNEVLVNKNLADSNWARETKPIMDSIIMLYKVNEIKQAYFELDESMRTIREKSSTINNDEDLSNFLNGYSEVASKEWNRLNDFYRVVFNEALDVY